MQKNHSFLGFLNHYDSSAEDLWLEIYSKDASAYEIRPSAVIWPKNSEEVQEILRKCNEAKIPVTFRGAGTSLSGQAIGPGLIIDTSRHMYKYSFSAAADLVWFEPGAIAGSINARLASNHRILGPDPASVEAATMGGILVNNASGMCCGIKNNSYQLIENLEFILPSGIKINTEDADSKTQFQQLCPQIFKMLSEIRLKILSSDKLYWRIKETYRIKNTIGYSLNSFIDFAHPLDIFKHLIIGSEGTLAFVSSAKMKTISKETDYLTSFVFFDSIADAIHLLEALDFEFFLAAEFFDQVSIRVLKNKLDEFALTLQKALPIGNVALLLEFKAHERPETIKHFYDAVEKCRGLVWIEPTLRGDTKVLLWKLRKGLLPILGASRPRGSTLLIEDIAFPRDKFLLGVLDLQRLLKSFYPESNAIFGHAKDGNLHFVVSLCTAVAEEVTKYQSFMGALVELVLKFNGSLKAEHGTGRNMAPFLEAQWGEEFFTIMKQIKETVDPLGILNPDVLISRVQDLHIKNLKRIPIVGEEIDKCIECGFCERTCPSHGFTLSPRQRIISLRKAFSKDLSKNSIDTFLPRGENFLDMDLRAAKSFRKHVLDSCARDSSCALSCPVGIDTGKLVKTVLEKSRSHLQRSVASSLAANMSSLMKVTQVVSSLSSKFSGNSVAAKFPLAITNKYLFVTSCPDALFGQKISKLLELCFPHSVTLGCCGLAFESKGFNKASIQAKQDFFIQLQAVLPNYQTKGVSHIVFANSPCHAQIFVELEDFLLRWFPDLKLLGSHELLIDLAKENLFSKEDFENRSMFLPCSLFVKNPRELKFAKQFAQRFDIPINQKESCCATAGDNGIFQPRLVNHAISKIEREHPEIFKAERMICSSLSCKTSLSASFKKIEVEDPVELVAKIFLQSISKRE